MHHRVLTLAALLSLAPLAQAQQEPPTKPITAAQRRVVAETLAGHMQPANAHANSIKRLMFSEDTLADVNAQFAALKVVLAEVLQAPALGRTTWITGTGPSGFPSPYAIDHVAGRFHVYAERRRPQHPVAPLPYVAQDFVFNTPNPEVSPVGTVTY